MRSMQIGAIFALLISGQVYADEIVRDVVVQQGEDLPLSVVTLWHNVVSCHMTTPSLGEITFKPGNASAPTDKFVFEAGELISYCQVTVKNVDAGDSGEWVLTYDTSLQVPRVQRYHITVETTEDAVEDEDDDGNNDHEDDDGDDDHEDVDDVAEDDNVITLSRINHLTRTGAFIDITLNKESFEEECYWIAPEKDDDDEEKETGTELTEAIRVEDRSNFVSCRIVIGPMAEGLIGNWSLCGKSINDDQRRCQPATIAWNNVRHPDSYWDTRAHPRFDHAVNFGGSVNPAVIGSGEAITCHVITPNDEDLVLTADVQYPHIERVSLENPSLCSVVIKDIDETSLGNWTVYGKFRSVLSSLNEVRLPIYLHLYNEDDPYEQAYNVTMLPEVNHVINLGTNLSIQVTGSSVVNNCQFTTPSGQTIEIYDTAIYEGVHFVSQGGTTACHIDIGPITKELLGEWELVGKFQNGNLFSERVQTFHIIQEDPENPIEDNNRRVELLTQHNFNTSMGTSHRITIAAGSFTNGESCHLRTPNGRQYTIMDGFNIDGVEVIEGSGIECGVTINLITEDLIGEWVLIARATRLSEAIERRLPFTIYVEERVNAIPADVNMAEGTNLYIRLQEPTDLYETCKLIGPNDIEISYETDTVYEKSCGYVVNNLKIDHSGGWEIVFGNKIIYRAFIDVNVFVSEPITVDAQTWTLGKPVHEEIGPDDTVYCRLRDPTGFIIFEDFGRCKIDIERATVDLQGVWTLSVIMPGTVVPQDITFVVDINEASSLPIVTTSVVRAAPSVLLTCSVPAQYQVAGCKFRDHRGNLMIAHQGIGQDGFSTSTGFQSETTNNSCTLRFTNPSSGDLGLWRCAVDTDDGTHYAFLTVTCPWLMQQPSVAESVVLEPTLTREREQIFSVVGESTTMSCSIDAPIRYCHFRASNGTIFNVRPGVSSQDYEYVGAGFDAGECGIRSRSLLTADSGRWSCHIGLLNTHDIEHSGQFYVTVQEKMTTSHYYDSKTKSRLVVQGEVVNQQRIEYCRFIRIDGFGFTSDNVPEGYSIWKAGMNEGSCMLYINEPTMLNLHPWTVVAKLRGVDGEIVRATTDNLLTFDNGPEANEPGPNKNPMFSLWLSVGLLSLGLSVLALALIPPRNREWTKARVSHLRNSFKKKPLPDFVNKQSLTPQSA